MTKTTGESRPKTGVLLDPYPLWLDAVIPVLSRANVEVVGRVSRRAEALRLICNAQPDLLVAELAGPDGDGDNAAWIRQVVARFPELRIVVLSMCEDEEEVEATLRAGATAYVLKTTHPDDLAAAVRQAFDHSIYLRRSPVSPRPAPAAHAEEASSLTRRELEILRLVAEGHANAELAKMLWVTEQTVKFHLSNVYRKLNVSNRTEASRWAQVNGLLAAEPLAADVA